MNMFNCCYPQKKDHISSEYRIVGNDTNSSNKKFEKDKIEHKVTVDFSSESDVQFFRCDDNQRKSAFKIEAYNEISTTIENKPTVTKNKPKNLNPLVRAYRDLNTYDISQRSLDAWPSGRGLISSGQAISFYVLNGMAMTLYLTTNLMQLVANEWLYLPSQYVLIGAFGLQFISFLFAYYERSQIAEIGEEIYNKLITDLDKKEENESQKKQAALLLEVSKLLTEGTFSRKCQAAAAAIGSLLSIAYAGVIIYALKAKEKILPLGPDSSTVAIIVLAFILSSNVLVIPFFISRVISAVRHLIQHIQLSLNCNEVKEKRLNNDCDKILVKLIQCKLKINELLFRSLTLLIRCINLIGFSAWCALELSCLNKDNNNGWERRWADAFRDPLAVMLFIGGAFMVMNGCIKLCWAGCDYFIKYCLLKNIEKKENRKNESCESLDDLNGSTYPDNEFELNEAIRKLTKTNVELALYYYLTEVDCNKNEYLMQFSGINEEDAILIQDLALSSNDLRHYASYILAKRLNLIDTI